MTPGRNRLTVAAGAVVALCLLAIRLHGNTAHAAERLFFEGYGRTSSGSEPRGRTIGMWFVNGRAPNGAPGTPFVLDTRRIAVSLACVHFCGREAARRLDPIDAGMLPSANIGNEMVAVSSVSLPDDLSWGIYRVSAVERDDPNAGPPTAVTFVDTTFVSVPPMPKRASMIDDHLAAVRRAFVGRTVQGFGSLALDCDDPRAVEKARAREAAVEHLSTLRTFPPISLLRLPPPPDSNADVGNEPSLVVTNIERPSGPARAWRLGGTVLSREGGDYGRFVAIEPLRVSFANVAHHPCVHPHLWLADEWEMRRALWIHTPLHVPETTPIRKGMSRTTVAHILGYPSVFGSVGEVNRLDVWHIPVLAPFEWTVRFRNDRVVDYQPPGKPP